MSPDTLLCMFNEFMSPQIELQFYQVGTITIWLWYDSQLYGPQFGSLWLHTRLTTNVRDGFCGKIHTCKHTILLLSFDCLRFWEPIGSFRLSMSRRKVISLSPSWSLIQREYYVLLGNTSKHKTISYLGKRDLIFFFLSYLSVVCV